MLPGIKAMRSVSVPNTSKSISVLGLFVILGLTSSSAFSGNIAIESETVLRTFNRSTAGGTSSQVAPVYEYLKLDVEELGLKELSFHVYGWGRFDAADSGYYGKRSDGSLLYGYLEYADAYQDMSLRLGRQHIFEGVADNAIDGLRVRSDIGDQFSISGYGGLPVATADSLHPGGDIIWGGRLAHRMEAFSDVGVSYKRIGDNGKTISSLVGIDSAFFLPMDMSLHGNSVRNIETAGWAEHNYELQIRTGDFTISPIFELFEYNHYFGDMAPAAGPFLSLAHSDEKLQVIGVNGDWRWSKNWTLGARAKAYKYEVNDAAQYVSASVSWFGKGLAGAGGEVGYMKGGAADNNYLLTRLFFSLDGLGDDIWVDSIGMDLLYTLYKQDIYGKNSSYCISICSGKKLDDNLELKLSADYSVDPYFKSDIRAMVALAYRFGADF